MADRPCKPDADFRKLWQTLMPGVAMPACGTGKADAKAPATPAPSVDDAGQVRPPRDER
jgi:hypothetical protein